MGIEKDIHQTHFTGEGQKSLINIIYTYHWLTDQIRKFLAEEDITLQQFNILRILRGSDPQPLSTLTIRDRMLDKMSDTSRIVDRLVLKGRYSDSVFLCKEIQTKCPSKYKEEEAKGLKHPGNVPLPNTQP